MSEPRPIAATFDTSEGAAYITFDSDIAAVTPGNWVATTFVIEQPTSRYQTNSVSIPDPATPTIVRVVGSLPGPGGPGPTIDYDDALNTLVGVNGRPVLSFAGFPCPPTP